jgi:hypothetical protein
LARQAAPIIAAKVTAWLDAIEREMRRAGGYPELMQIHWSVLAHGAALRAGEINDGQ